MPVIFVDTEGKQHAVASSKEAIAEARANKWAPRDSVINITDETGTPLSLNREDIDAFLQTGESFQAAPQSSGFQEARRQELLNKAEDFGGQYEAFGRAGLRTLLPGVDEVLGDKEYARLLREDPEFSGANLAGSITGVGVGLGSAGVFGGVGKLSKGLGGAAGLSTRAAVSAGSKAGKLGKVAQFGVEGAVEGALFEGANIINDAVLLGDDFDVDAVGSRLTGAALLGGGIGGVFGATASVSKRLLEKNAAKATKLSPTVIPDEIRQIAPGIDNVLETKADDMVRARRAQLELEGKAPSIAQKAAQSEVDNLYKTIRAKNKRFQNANIQSLHRKNNAVGFRALVKDMDEFSDALGKMDELAGTDYLQKLEASPGFDELNRVSTEGLENTLQAEARTPLGQLLSKAYDTAQVFEGIKKSPRKGLLSKESLLGIAGTAAVGMAAGPLLAGLSGMGASMARYALWGFGTRKAITKGLSDNAKKFLTYASKGTPALKHSTVASAIGGMRFYRDKAKDSNPTVARIKEIDLAVQNREETRAQIEAQLSPLITTNPDFGMKLVDKTMSKLEYYQSKIPRSPREGAMGQKEGLWKPSAEALSEYSRTLYAGEYPEKALQRMFESGRVDRTMTETVKTLYPVLWEEQRKEVIDALMEKPRTIPYNRRLFLSKLYDMELETTANPQFGLQVQNYYAAKAAEAEQQQPKMPGVPPEPELTKAQRLINR